MSGFEFDITIPVTVFPIAGGWPEPLNCPTCQAPLDLHQPQNDMPHRLLASCPCEECGVWYSLVPSADRARVYLLRLPAIAEMREALSRQGWA
jgi:C4-type Zn-finger protein